MQIVIFKGVVFADHPDGAAVPMASYPGGAELLTVPNDTLFEFEGDPPANEEPDYRPRKAPAKPKKPKAS